MEGSVCFFDSQSANSDYQYWVECLDGEIVYDSRLEELNAAGFDYQLDADSVEFIDDSMDEEEEASVYAPASKSYAAPPTNST